MLAEICFIITSGSRDSQGKAGSSGKFIVCGKTSTGNADRNALLEDRSHILSHFQCTARILQDKVNVRYLKALYFNSDRISILYSTHPVLFLSVLVCFFFFLIFTTAGFPKQVFSTSSAGFGVCILFADHHGDQGRDVTKAQKQCAVVGSMQRDGLDLGVRCEDRQHRTIVQVPHAHCFCSTNNSKD